MTIGKFSFACDVKGKLVPVPSDPRLQGFVVRGEELLEFARLQIFAGNDAREREQLSAVWKESYEARATTIFPEIIACGEDDGIPYYVSKFPHGEPLSIYLDDSPPWPGQMAARVLCRFIGSLRNQAEIPINQYLISYDSLWVEKTIYGPRILIGDITLVPSPTASTDNAALILSVFKDLTKEDVNDPAITGLFHKLSQGPMSLGVVEKALRSFSITGDSRDLEWTEACDPDPMLERCLARIDMVSEDQLIEAKDRSKSGKTGFGGLSRFLVNQTHYRSAIELDQTEPSFKIPRGLLPVCTLLIVLGTVIGLGIKTDPGKRIFEKIGGWIAGFTYEPTLVMPVEPEPQVPEKLETKPEVENKPYDTSQISLNGNLFDAEGILNSTITAGEDSINSYSVSN